MKILVDTCVWSLLLRRKTSSVTSDEEHSLLTALIEAIQDGRVAIIGPIRQELLSGIRETSQFEKLRSSLKPFEDEVLQSTHYEEAARLFNFCRGRGVECGATDVLMCSVAVQKNWSIMTSDIGLRRCIELLKAEGLLNS